MFFVSYISAELRRRRGRTVLTALGLAIGVGLVVVVSALSTASTRRRTRCFSPLTGVGTDMSVTRPLRVSGGRRAVHRRAAAPGSGRSARRAAPLAAGERRGAPAAARRAKPGDQLRARRPDQHVPAELLRPPGREGRRARRRRGRRDLLTLNSIHVEGRVPERGDVVGPGPAGAGPPQDIDFKNLTVTGIDTSEARSRAGDAGRDHLRPLLLADRPPRGGREPELRAARGHLARRVASASAAKKFRVVGLAEAPLGGQASDVYVELGQLQTVSDREGRVNAMNVRATDSDAVTSVAKRDRERLLGRAGDHRRRPRRPRGRLARRRPEPRRQARHRARRDRARRRVPDREPADALLGQQARARAGHAEGARLAAAAGRAPGRGRVARAGRARRCARRARRPRAAPRS